MLTDELMKIDMNKQTVSFQYVTDGIPIRRTIIYESSISQYDICQYFLTSISHISNQIDLEIGEIEPCICYVSPQELTKQINHQIDNYWIDGTVYLMEGEEKEGDSFELIVFPEKIEEKVVIAKLKQQNRLIYVNTLEECWIKRKGQEYSIKQMA